MPFLRSIKQYFAGRKTFPEEYQRILQRKVRIYKKLNGRQKNLLQERMKIFMDEKIFEGCGGLSLTDEMKVIIAAYACVLILEKDSDYYPGLRSILVYPDDYVAPVYEEDEGGVVTEGQEQRMGESWDTGSVVLSWQDIRDTTLNLESSQNLIIHEFAHQLDHQYGLSAGINLSGEVTDGDEWTRELARIYRGLLKSARSGRADGLLDLYGATNPAECFAVIMEAFIESPRQLQIHHRKLYTMLRDFFSLDPARL